MAGTTTYYGISYPTSTDYVKDGATAMQTIATGFDSAVAIPTYNNQTGTSYTFVLADTGKTVTSDNASAVTFTIPPQASVAWANNTTLTVRNLGAGVVTIAGGSGVTVTNTAQTVAQYGEVKLIRTASNAWTVVPASGGASGLTKITTNTFSAQSAVTVNNCFSSTYRNYLVVLTVKGSVHGTDLRVQLRKAGTNATTSYLMSGFYYDYNGTMSNKGNGVGTSSFLIGASNNNTNINVMNFGNAYSSSGSGDYVALTVHNVLSQYPAVEIFSNIRAADTFDGLYLFPASGTITGNITIYGYEN